MKMKTALKQSIVSVKFLSVVVLILLGLSIKYRSWVAIVPLVFCALYLFGDAYNIVAIRRKAAQDPSYLDKRVN